MKRILAPILLMVFLFPSLALGGGLDGANWAPEYDGYSGSSGGGLGFLLLLGLIVVVGDVIFNFFQSF